MAFQYWPVYFPDPPLNNAAAPDGAPEGMPPGDVNDAMRQHMAATAEALEAWTKLLENDPSGDPSNPTPIPPPGQGEPIPDTDPVEYYSLAYLNKAYPAQDFIKPQRIYKTEVEDPTDVPALTVRSDAGVQPTLQLAGLAPPDIFFYDNNDDSFGTIGFSAGLFTITQPIVANLKYNWPVLNTPLAFTRYYNEEDYTTGQSSYLGVRAERGGGGYATQLITYSQEDVGTDYAGLVITGAGDGSLGDMTWNGYMIYRPSSYAGNPAGFDKDHFNFSLGIHTAGWVVSHPSTGGVSLTTNDGYGNAQIAFNHTAGTPDQAGSSARITSTVDSSTGELSFQILNNAVAGVASAATQVFEMTTSKNVSNEPLEVLSTIYSTSSIDTLGNVRAKLALQLGYANGSVNGDNTYAYWYTNSTTTPAAIYANTNNYLYFRPRTGTYYIIGEQQSTRVSGSRFHNWDGANKWSYCTRDYIIEGNYFHSVYQGVSGSTAYIEIAIQYKRNNTWYTI